MTPQDQLRLMLEGANAKDLGIKSPLEEIDEKSLDEVIKRIDENLTLGQIPRPEDRDKLILLYRSKRGKFLEELSLMQQEGRKRISIKNLKGGGASSRQIPKPLPKISTEDLLKGI